MNSNIDFICDLINIEKQKIKDSFPHFVRRIAIIELTRCYDHTFCLVSFLLKEKNKETEKSHLNFNFISNGFWDALNLFMDESINDSGYPLMPTNEYFINWTNSVLIQLGQIGHILKFIELTKQGVTELNRVNNTFYFKNISPYPGSEQNSVQDFRWWQQQQDFRVSDKHRLDALNSIVKKQIISEVNINMNHFIKYGCTKELDEYYEILGRFHRKLMVGSDAFHSEAKFDELKYFEIVQIIEALIGYSLKHKDHCIALLKKSNYSINPWNVYTIYERTEDLAFSISTHKNIKYSSVLNFLLNFALTDLNKDKLGDAPGSSTPPLIKISQEHVLKSIAGILGNPFTYLIRFLKSNFEKEYFIAVNQRENIFKYELYNLFSNSPNILKCSSNLVLKKDGKILTDIDAVLFDNENNTLLLIQLKWMDDYGTSMKGRVSMSKNLNNSAIKWIDAISDWIKNHGEKELMNKLKFEINKDKLSDLKIDFLIIGRNFSHFSDREADKRATWCSWYKLNRAINENQKITLNLKMLMYRLKNNSTDNFVKHKIENVELKLGKYNFFISMT